MPTEKSGRRLFKKNTYDTYVLNADRDRYWETTWYLTYLICSVLLKTTLSDCPIYFAESDGKFNANPPVRRLASGFETPQAKMCRTSSMIAVHTGNNTDSQEPKPDANKLAKPDDTPAGEVLPGSYKDKPAGLLPGANPPTRRSKRPEREMEPPSKQRYDKYYHRQGCGESPSLWNCFYYQNQKIYD